MLNVSAECLENGETVETVKTVFYWPRISQSSPPQVRFDLSRLTFSRSWFPYPGGQYNSGTLIHIILYEEKVTFVYSLIVVILIGHCRVPGNYFSWEGGIYLKNNQDSSWM